MIFVASPRIVQALERLAEEVLRDRGQVFNHKSANIAMEVFNFDTATFSGMACASFKLSRTDNSQQGPAGLQDFRCFMGSPNATGTRLKTSKVVRKSSESNSVHVDLSRWPSKYTNITWFMRADRQY